MTHFENNKIMVEKTGDEGGKKLLKSKIDVLNLFLEQTLCPDFQILLKILFQYHKVFKTFFQKKCQIVTGLVLVLKNASSLVKTQSLGHLF